MMKKIAEIQMIPIDAIIVVNPRVRGVKNHALITENIHEIGLKRPITVRRLDDFPDSRYALICGQGRLESFQMLGQLMVPAIVIDVDKETGHLMSIIENIARRTPRAGETLDQITALRKRGYGDAEIGKKIGYTATWVNNISQLLERGERRLLAAVEAGRIPLYLAVEVSRGSDADAQSMLLDLYESGDLDSKNVGVIRKLLDQRARIGKNASVTTFGGGRNGKKLGPDELMKLFHRETEKHRLLQKKAAQAQQMLLLAQQIFKGLYANKEFCDLLRLEKFDSVPTPLADAAKRGGLA